jgi:predicted nucleic acid-binding protein
VRAFIDTNVAVYALTSDEPKRCAQAEALLARDGMGLQLCISTQVLLETFNVLVNKKRIAAPQALNSVHALANFEVIAPSARAALDALALAAAHKLSTWDAFIIQAALEAGCDTLFSEDLQAGRRFGKLVVVNPFDASAHEPVAAPAPQARSAQSYRRKPARRA